MCWAGDSSSLNETNQVMARLGLLIYLKRSWCACGPDPAGDKKGQRSWDLRQFVAAMGERIPFRCCALSLETKCTSKEEVNVGVPHKIIIIIICFENIIL